MVKKKIPLIDIPTKKVEDMKTSEIIDELSNGSSEERIDDLDEELLDRYPFNYHFKMKFKKLEEQIKLLNELLRHDHKDGEIVIKLYCKEVIK